MAERFTHRNKNKPNLSSFGLFEIHFTVKVWGNFSQSCLDCAAGLESFQDLAVLTAPCQDLFAVSHRKTDNASLS